MDGLRAVRKDIARIRTIRREKDIAANAAVAAQVETAPAAEQTNTED